jgi:hypothetical protein
MDEDIETSQYERNNNDVLSQLQDYFDKLLPLVLGAKESDLKSSLRSNDTIEKLERFTNDHFFNVIYFTKKRDDEQEGKFY